ncbi:MAG: DUF4230 domain-containing protein [Solobacterium sp.]|nr:DUF4230 domain-containing protein [Solobacterium sp.]
MEDKKRKLHLGWLLKLGIVLGCAAFVFFGLKSCTTHKIEPFHIDTDRNDPVLGYKSSEIREMIAGESREKSDLVVYEQDFASSLDITDMFLNISWFRKTQTVHMYATASYSVDLSKVTGRKIDVSQKDRTITVRIPHSALRDVTVDYKQTTFDAIDRSIFGWGDIKLTPEQQNEVEKRLHDAMAEEAGGEQYLAEADKSALEQVEKIYRTLLKKLSGGVTIKIIFDD